MARQNVTGSVELFIIGTGVDLTEVKEAQDLILTVVGNKTQPVLIGASTAEGFVIGVEHKSALDAATLAADIAALGSRDFGDENPVTVDFAAVTVEAAALSYTSVAPVAEEGTDEGEEEEEVGG